MVQLSESNMQLDHAWRCNDYAGWLQEVELWQARHDEALAELERLFAFIHALRYAVRSHSETIAAYQDVCRRHVREIADGCGAAAADEALAFAHAQIAANHTHVRDAHDQIRRHHCSAAARLRGLVEVVDGTGTSDHRFLRGDRQHCASQRAEASDSPPLYCPDERGKE